MLNNDGNHFKNIGLAAALANSYSANREGLLAQIAALLEACLSPQELVVERRPVRMFSQEKRVQAVRLTLGEDVLELREPKAGAGPYATHIKVVRGITLKTEEMGLEKWLEIVELRLQELAARNERAYFAIQNFVEAQRM